MSNPQSPEPESAARAERLRKQIKDIENGAAESPASAVKEDAKAPPSPRDFIQQRMRDLDRPK